MKLFDSIRSAISTADDDLTKQDVLEMRDKYKNALEICDYIIKWSDHHKRSDAKDFSTGDEHFIMYESSSNYNEYVGNFPDPIKSAYNNLKSEFNPHDATTVAGAERCFEEHGQFASNTKDVIEHMLEELDELEDKLERVEYMQDADEDFEHDGFENPNHIVEDQLSDYVDERVSENSEGSEEESEMEKMDINQLVYFIAEELRNQRNEEYDMNLYNDLYSAYPEQSEQVSERLSSHARNRHTVEQALSNIDSEEYLPPLKDKHIEFYIIPRVFDGVPSKTPNEIGML